MKQNYSIDKGKRTFTYQDLQKVQKNINNNEKLGGWTSVIKGQHVTGVISEVNDQIVLNFNGKEVKVPKGLLQDPVIGEARLFEVLNVTDKIIEMREKNEKEDKESKDSDKASIIRLDKDPYTLLTLKQYTAMLMEKNKEYQGTKSKIEEIIVKMTEQDYLALQNEGFSVEDMSIDRLYAALKRVKEEVKPSQSYEPDQITNSKIISLTDITEKMIETKLREANLPITKESVQRVSLALELSDAVSKMNEQAVTYLIRQELDPTIANIYKANYSGVDRQEKNLTLSEEAWSNLLPQVKEQIEAAGYEVNKETLKEARWLVEKNLPLTIESFVYYKDLENIKNDFNPDSILNKIVEGMKEGLDPKDTSLSFENTKKIENIIADIQSIHENTIVKATKENSELTIQNLIHIQKNRQPENDKIEDATKELPIEAVKAKRQLEEIRLKMTAEAALKLEKKGFHIETERLEKVVESLRELEDSYYRNLLCEAAVEPSQEHIDILKETTQSMEQLKYSPSYILGRTLYQSNRETIPSLLSAGDHLKLGLEKANEAYETLMTIPNREYGDSIQKAFKNMASLLEEMNIENTIYNQRAVRILGYNSMDITKESIDQVKAYDMQVNTIIKNLHPAITVRLIKEGTNPLNIPIQELNKVIDKMKQEQGLTQEEKYSSYLHRLEREKGISEEERKAYIGIYRLLYQIDKTDGAALGAVVKADREVTLNNLLTAIRTSRVGSMDTMINDEFGTLQELNVKNETISEQLKAVFENSKKLTDRIENNNTANDDNRIEYLHTMLKSMLEEVTPHKLSGILESYTGTPVNSLEDGLWNTLKDTSIEKLFDHFQKIDGVVDSEAYDYTQKVEELREVFKNSEQAIRFLNDLNLPSSSTNIMLAGQLLSNGGTLFKKLQKLQKENKEEKVEMPLKEITEFTDTIIDKKTMNETYAKLEDQIEEALSSAFTSEQLDIKKLTDLNSIRMQINFAKRLADREFYLIPLATEEGVTNINLTIIRGSNHVGKVSVSVYSEFLGKIKSDFIIKDKVLKGFISCDNRFGLELIQKNTQFIDTIEAEDISVKQIDFGIQQREIDSYTYQKLEKEDIENSNTNEKVLYQLAKNFIHMIKEIEKSV